MSIPEKPQKAEVELPDAIKLSELSIESLEVLDHFGIEAPEILNKYSMTLEDAVIEQVAHVEKLQKENERLKKLLTKNNIKF